MGKRKQKNTLLDIMMMPIRPIRIALPQKNGYVKCFDDNKTMSLLSDNK